MCATKQNNLFVCKIYMNFSSLAKKNQIIARLDSFLSAHERNIDTSIQTCVFLILRKSTHLII